jgi:hypothetical protein
MLTWLKKRVHHQDLAAAERRGVDLVRKVFGPDVEDVTPIQERPTAA